MKLICLDPSNVVGWSHSNGTGGIWILKRPRKNVSEQQRAERLHNRLDRVYEHYGIDTVIYENGQTPKSPTGKVQRYIELWCAEQDIPCHGVSPQDIKRFATGNPFAHKKQMLDLARRKFGGIHNSDHADARWLRAYWERRLSDEQQQ